MDWLDALQWPAMIVTIMAAWLLVLLVEQCALDHLGLAHAGLGHGDTPGNPCRHEYQRRQQE
jgi:hypothetical protein